MDHSQLAGVSSTLAQISAALLAVALTLVALIPTLVELMRARGLSFLSSTAAEGKLRSGLTWLSYTIWLFVISTLGGLAGQWWPSFGLVTPTAIVLTVGTLVVAAASYRISTLTRTVAVGPRR